MLEDCGYWRVTGRGAIQPLFLCAAKKKPLAVKRKRQRGISISPFAIPLKRPRRGLRPPSLDFPRGLVCTGVISDQQNAMQMRIEQTGDVIEILCVCFDFHTSNIQRAQTKRLALCIVRSGNPILRPPEGRSDDGWCNDKTHNGTICFSGASALFRSPAPLFSPFFSGKTEKNGPPEASRTDWCRKECTFGASEKGQTQMRLALLP